MANVIAKCECGKVLTLTDWRTLWERDEAADKLWRTAGAIQCPCGRKPNGYVVRAKQGKKECGAWCTDGTGRTCTCVCEGRNHGIKFSHTGALWFSR